MCPGTILLPKNFIGDLAVSLSARRGLCTEVGFVCVSGPVLARDLFSWVTEVNWVLLRVT